MPLLDRLRTHIALAEQLAKSDREKGADRLWHGEAGEAAANWLDEWQNAATGFPPLDGEDYIDLFAGLLRGVTVRPVYGQHPRLSIWGPLEARLVQADLMILGGLNEGNWPPEAPIDPWMSRPMKTSFGLPLPERRIGLSAHDFVQLASSPEVILTRARRAGNAPTVPSRFLLQLETVLRALGYHRDDHDALAPAQAWDAWARQLDYPAAEPKACPPPEPRPPAAARPQTLSVTNIGTWRRNPYAIYARYILKLKKLDPLEAQADASDKGSIIHDALDRFIRKFPDHLPPQALDELLAIGRDVFKPYQETPEVGAFWWPRFERIAAWFVDEERARRASGIAVMKSEADGAIPILEGFTLKGRADRIDRLPDGTLAIIDYKTGATPTKGDVKSGIEPQLPLLALIAAQGGFKDIEPAQTAELAYWKLTGGSEPVSVQTVNEPVEILMETTQAGLEVLVKQFADPQTPYQAIPKPNLQPHYDDYAHLARLAEWGRTEDT
ncbi:MAG TPA: double-strand break repair protein AddB [Rhizomicrobium sp.]